MYAYQDEAVEWMEIREDDPRVPGGFLCHEMGLGKTHMMCRLISRNIERAPRTLLLTTKSTLESWKGTLRSYSNFVFDVKEGPFCDVTPGRPLVMVGTHHSILKHVDTYKAVGFDRLIVDEAHILRNATKIFQRAMELAQVVRYRWGVTATPFNNCDADMRPYVLFLKPDHPHLPIGAFKHYFIRKLRKDVIPDGPKLRISKMVYNFETVEEQMMYDYVSGRIDNTHQWIQQNAGQIPWRQRGHMWMTLILRQRQAAIHPQLVLNAEKVWAAQMPGSIPVVDWDPRKVTKANKIIDLIRKDQADGKSTMVITHFKEEISLLKMRLEELKIPVDVIDGNTTSEKRRELELKVQHVRPVSEVLSILDEITAAKRIRQMPEDMAFEISRWLAPPPSVILLQIQAGGVGISLPWVHHVINAAPDWNPFLEQQSMYRAYRINTQHDVDVTSMYFRDTIDVAIQARQKQKMERAIEWLDDHPDTIEQFVAKPAGI